MARMSEKELSDIISRDKPGFRVVKRDAGPTPDLLVDSSPGTSESRGLEDIKRQYLGTGKPVGDAPQAGAEPKAGATQAADDEIVVIAPQEGAADPWKPGPGPKSVVVSGKERRVVAEQG